MVHEVLPLEQAMLAHQKMNAGEVLGRIVLAPRFGPRQRHAVANGFSIPHRHLGIGFGERGARPWVVVNARATGLVLSQFLRRDPFEPL